MSATEAVGAGPRFAISNDLRQVAYRVLAVGIICAVLAVLSDGFLTTNNLLNVLRQASLVFFMASGLRWSSSPDGSIFRSAPISDSAPASPQAR